MSGLVVRSIVKPSEYHDSVNLMLVARELAGQAGIQDASVVMGTEANKSILAGAGLLTPDIQAAGPNDLVIAVRASEASTADQALARAEEMLKRKSPAAITDEHKPRSIRGALSVEPGANMAVISVAGRYAAGEAWEALHHGLHVLLFSDNVSLEDEIALKQYARQHDLLLMGPGAGTAIINGVALGFANALPRGPVGIVSAAGTGLQEVSTLLARRGVGVSQCIGTGGRDLKKEVGGIMMLHSLQALQQDLATEVLVLISKPPADEVAHSIIEQVHAGNKPTVVCFLGGAVDSPEMGANLVPARTLQECSLLAARIVNPGLDVAGTMLQAEQKQLAGIYEKLALKSTTGQKYLRGLFSGGTLCYEAQVVWKDMLKEPVHSNAPLPGAPSLPDSTRSTGHAAIDLGEEEFTVGRPHPMIDNDLRIRRLLQEAADPETSVIMLDVVLGYGAHPDPAGELGPAIQQARAITEASGRCTPVIASVTGTEGDPQGLSRTTAVLEAAGAVVCDSNAAAARLCAMLVSR